jgi:hypothetical protein
MCNNNPDIVMIIKAVEAAYRESRSCSSTALIFMTVGIVAVAGVKRIIDEDGQVTVKSFTSIKEALEGFCRSKSRGLHCFLQSTKHVDLELRARALRTSPDGCPKWRQHIRRQQSW